MAGSAKFFSLGPGQGRFEIRGVNTIKPDKNSQLNMVIVDGSYADGDIISTWSQKSSGGFKQITITNFRVRGAVIDFEVGSEVVNALATAGMNSYVLKIKDQANIPQSMVITMNDRAISSDKVGDQSCSEKDESSDIDTNAPANQLAGAAMEQVKAKIAAQQAAFNANKEGTVANNLPTEKQDNFVSNNNAPNTQATSGSHNLSPQAPLDPKPAATPSSAPSGSGAGGFIIKVISALVVLGLIAAAVMYFLGMFSPNGAPVDPVKQACSLQEHKDDKAILNDCLAQKPNNEQLFALMAEAMKNDHCEIVLRVLRTKGRSDNGGVYAYTYAHYADPQSDARNKCIVKNAEDAKYWSERVSGDKTFNQQEADKLIKLLP